MKNKTFLLPVIAMIFLSVSISCSTKNQVKTDITQETIPAGLLDAPPNFFNKHDEYYEWQSKQLLELTELALEKYPPQFPEPLERQMAMLMLDAVFHDVEAPHRPPVQDFHHRRMKLVLDDIKKSTISEGAKFWKLYDMGFIIRTKSVTVGFDITRAYSSKSENFALTDDFIKEIVDQCDILFISHYHGDHADETVARFFLDQGKPVVAAPDIWDDKPIHEEITHLERKVHEKQTVPVKSGNLGLEVVIYPGHQGANILNNVAVVFTPDGITYCHTGDQSLAADFSWIDEVGEKYEIDILVPNCWTTDPQRTAKGYNPKLIIPSHENELGHTIDHREAYALDYSRWNVPYPKLIMAWGEFYHYIP